MEKQELQTLRLWNPLFPKIYRKNEWGDTENEPEDMLLPIKIQFAIC